MDVSEDESAIARIDKSASDSAMKENIFGTEKIKEKFVKTQTPVPTSEQISKVIWR